MWFLRKEWFPLSQYPMSAISNEGKCRRLSQVLGPDGRTVVVAMDHGMMGVSPLAALAEPARLIQQVLAGGADALLTSFGIASRFADSIGQAGLILRLDGGVTSFGEDWTPMRPVYAVEDAIRLGAHAVAVMGLVGGGMETNSLRALAKVATDCRRWGVPLLAEMLDVTPGSEGLTAERVAAVARIGAEMGADLIKTNYVGPLEAYRSVTDSCFVPVLVLGGKAKAEADTLREVSEAMEAGAAGVVMGRNIWQNAQPQAMTRAVVEVVHGNSSVA